MASFSEQHTSKKPCVLIISIVPELTVRIASGLHKLGFQVNVLGKEPYAGLRILPYVKHYAVFDKDYWNDLDDAKNFAEFVERYCQRWLIDIILPLEVPAARLTKHAENFLKTPVVKLFSNEKRDFFNNKWNFYQFLKEHKLPTPKTQLLDSFDQVVLEDDFFPIIIKPLSEFGSNGIHKFDNNKGLTNYLLHSGIEPPAIVQEFLPGIDFSVAILANQGEVNAWAINQFNDDLSQRQFVNEPKVLELATQIIQHMEYSGIAVLDIRLDTRDNTYKGIEINPRIGSSDYFYSKAGINFSALWIAQSLNKSIEGVTFNPVTNKTVQLNLYERLLPIFSSPPIDVIDNVIYGICKRNPTLKNLYSTVTQRLLKREKIAPPE